MQSSLEITKDENEQHLDLTKLEGKQAELVGTLWSLNGVWWFEYADKKVYLTSKSGRSESYEVNWHGCKVRVKGQIKQQMRASLDQISLKTARDLEMYSVIVNAQVSLESEVDENDEGNRFRALYEQTPKMKDGVFQLLAEPSFRRNIVGGETTARGFVERNWPHIVHTLSNANGASKDTIFLRMNDPKIDSTLRQIYASILAMAGDKRGSEYLKSVVKLGTKNKPEPDTIYLLGEIGSWKLENQKQIEGDDWLEELSIHCLKVAPGEAFFYSSIPEMLCNKKSKLGIDLMIQLILDGKPKAKEVEDDDDLPSDSEKGDGRVDMSGLSRMLGLKDFEPTSMSYEDYASILLPEILYAEPDLVTTDILLKLLEKFPKADSNRRMLFKVMLIRDDPSVIKYFLKDLEEDFWLTDLDEYSGPKIIAAIKEEVTRLKAGTLRKELEMMLLRRSDHAAATFAKMLDNPQTPIENLNELSWSLLEIEGGKSHADAIARVIRQRLLAKPQDEPDAMTVSRMIERVGESSEPRAVDEMIQLLGADFSKLADEWVSVDEFRNHIAGQLAEMTGQSFGVDQDAWNKWFAKKQSE